ncbi:hypothetical protein OWV82_006322 [Melia azedarach]|uniref:Uncharacterized protein n=1 Tax=Melia azedarach TaxID=155640 RepID=A0ACC1YHN0_MELAZ|nr:hypothetical protein OWV82_006322 [Melia azedarach]
MEFLMGNKHVPVLALFCIASWEMQLSTVSATTINFGNDLQSSVSVNCHPKEADPWTHVLKPFTVDSWELSEATFCNVTSDEKGCTDAFAIYDPKRDSVRCPLSCQWDVVDSGVTGRPDDYLTPPDIFFNWKKPKVAENEASKDGEI